MANDEDGVRRSPGRGSYAAHVTKRTNVYRTTRPPSLLLGTIRAHVEQIFDPYMYILYFLEKLSKTLLFTNTSRFSEFRQYRENKVESGINLLAYFRAGEHDFS